MLGEIGRYKKAAFYLKRAIDLHNDSAQAHNNLGAIYQHLGDHNNAERHLREAIRLRKKDPLPRANLARVMIDSGRLPEAERELQHALTLNSEQLLARRTLVHLRLAQGEIEPAIDLLEKLIETFPKAAGLKHDLAMILATHHDSTKADIERAIDMAEQLTEKLDGSFDAPRAFDLLAVTRAAKGQFELALDASNTPSVCSAPMR